MSQPPFIPDLVNRVILETLACRNLFYKRSAGMSNGVHLMHYIDEMFKFINL